MFRKTFSLILAAVFLAQTGSRPVFAKEMSSKSGGGGKRTAGKSAGPSKGQAKDSGSSCGPLQAQSDQVSTPEEAVKLNASIQKQIQSLREKRKQETDRYEEARKMHLQTTQAILDAEYVAQVNKSNYDPNKSGSQKVLQEQIKAENAKAPLEGFKKAKADEMKAAKKAWEKIDDEIACLGQISANSPCLGALATLPNALKRKYFKPEPGGKGPAEPKTLGDRMLITDGSGVDFDGAGQAGRARGGAIIDGRLESSRPDVQGPTLTEAQRKAKEEFQRKYGGNLGGDRDFYEKLLSGQKLTKQEAERFRKLQAELQKAKGRPVTSKDMKEELNRRKSAANNKLACVDALANEMAALFELPPEGAPPTVDVLAPTKVETPEETEKRVRKEAREAEQAQAIADGRARKEAEAKRQKELDENPLMRYALEHGKLPPTEEEPGFLGQVGADIWNAPKAGVKMITDPLGLTKPISNLFDAAATTAKGAVTGFRDKVWDPVKDSLRYNVVWPVSDRLKNSQTAQGIGQLTEDWGNGLIQNSKSLQKNLDSQYDKDAGALSWSNFKQTFGGLGAGVGELAGDHVVLGSKAVRGDVDAAYTLGERAAITVGVASMFVNPMSIGAVGRLVLRADVGGSVLFAAGSADRFMKDPSLGNAAWLGLDVFGGGMSAHQLRLASKANQVNKGVSSLQGYADLQNAAALRSQKQRQLEQQLAGMAGIDSTFDRTKFIRAADDAAKTKPGGILNPFNWGKPKMPDPPSGLSKADNQALQKGFQDLVDARRAETAAGSQLAKADAAAAARARKAEDLAKLGAQAGADPWALIKAAEDAARKPQGFFSIPKWIKGPAMPDLPSGLGKAERKAIQKGFEDLVDAKRAEDAAQGQLYAKIKTTPVEPVRPSPSGPEIRIRTDGGFTPADVQKQKLLDEIAGRQRAQQQIYQAAQDAYADASKGGVPSQDAFKIAQQKAFQNINRLENSGAYTPAFISQLKKDVRAGTPLQPIEYQRRARFQEVRQEFQDAYAAAKQQVPPKEAYKMAQQQAFQRLAQYQSKGWLGAEAAQGLKGEIRTGAALRLPLEAPIKPVSITAPQARAGASRLKKLAMKAEGDSIRVSPALTDPEQQKLVRDYIRDKQQLLKAGFSPDEIRPKDIIEGLKKRNPKLAQKIEKLEKDGHLAHAETLNARGLEDAAKAGEEAKAVRQAEAALPAKPGKLAQTPPPAKDLPQKTPPSTAKKPPTPAEAPTSVKPPEVTDAYQAHLETKRRIRQDELNRMMDPKTPDDFELLTKRQAYEAEFNAKAEGFVKRMTDEDLLKNVNGDDLNRMVEGNRPYGTDGRGARDYAAEEWLRRHPGEGRLTEEQMAMAASAQVKAEDAARARWQAEAALPAKPGKLAQTPPPAKDLPQKAPPEAGAADQARAKARVEKEMQEALDSQPKAKAAKAQAASDRLAKNAEKLSGAQAQAPIKHKPGFVAPEEGQIWDEYVKARRKGLSKEKAIEEAAAQVNKGGVEKITPDKVAELRDKQKWFDDADKMNPLAKAPEPPPSGGVQQFAAVPGQPGGALPVGAQARRGGPAAIRGEAPGAGIKAGPEGPKGPPGGGPPEIPPGSGGARAIGAGAEGAAEPAKKIRGFGEEISRRKDAQDILAQRSTTKLSPEDAKKVEGLYPLSERSKEIVSIRSADDLKPGQRYNYVIFEDGHMEVAPILKAGEEKGIKHYQIANNREVSFAGTIIKDEAGNIKIDMQSGTFAKREGKVLDEWRYGEKNATVLNTAAGKILDSGKVTVYDPMLGRAAPVAKAKTAEDASQAAAALAARRTQEAQDLKEVQKTARDIANRQWGPFADPSLNSHQAAAMTDLKIMKGEGLNPRELELLKKYPDATFQELKKAMEEMGFPPPERAKRAHSPGKYFDDAAAAQRELGISEDMLDLKLNRGREVGGGTNPHWVREVNGKKLHFKEISAYPPEKAAKINPKLAQLTPEERIVNELAARAYYGRFSGLGVTDDISVVRIKDKYVLITPDIADSIPSDLELVGRRLKQEDRIDIMIGHLATGGVDDHFANLRLMNETGEVRILDREGSWLTRDPFSVDDKFVAERMQKGFPGMPRDPAEKAAYMDRFKQVREDFLKTKNEFRNELLGTGLTKERADKIIGNIEQNLDPKNFERNLDRYFANLDSPHNPFRKRVLPESDGLVQNLKNVIQGEGGGAPPQGPRMMARPGELPLPGAQQGLSPQMALGRVFGVVGDDAHAAGAARAGAESLSKSARKIGFAPPVETHIPTAVRGEMPVRHPVGFEPPWKQNMREDLIRAGADEGAVASLKNSGKYTPEQLADLDSKFIREAKDLNEDLLKGARAAQPPAIQHPVGFLASGESKDLRLLREDFVKARARAASDEQAVQLLLKDNKLSPARAAELKQSGFFADAAKRNEAYLDFHQNRRFEAGARGGAGAQPPPAAGARAVSKQPDIMAQAPPGARAQAGQPPQPTGAGPQQGKLQFTPPKAPDEAAKAPRAGQPPQQPPQPPAPPSRPTQLGGAPGEPPKRGFLTTGEAKKIVTEAVPKAEARLEQVIAKIEADRAKKLQQLTQEEAKKLGRALTEDEIGALRSQKGLGPLSEAEKRDIFLKRLYREMNPEGFVGRKKGKGGIAILDTDAGIAKSKYEGDIFVEHHGRFYDPKNPEVDTTMQLLSRIEQSLKEGKGLDDTLASLKQRFQFFTTDNLGDGAWSVWILENLDTVARSQGLRDAIRLATHYEDFGVFGSKFLDDLARLKKTNPSQYEKLRKAIELQDAVFNGYNKALASGRYGKIADATGLDRFGHLSPEQQRELMKEVQQHITRAVWDADFRRAQALEFGQAREAAKLAAPKADLNDWAKGILKDNNLDQNLLGDIHVYDKNIFTGKQGLFADWGAVPLSHGKPIQVGFQSLDGGKTGFIMAVPNGRKAESLTYIGDAVRKAETEKVERLIKEGKLPSDAKPGMVFGRDALQLSGPGGLHLTRDEIAKAIAEARGAKGGEAIAAAKGTPPTPPSGGGAPIAAKPPRPPDAPQPITPAAKAPGEAKGPRAPKDIQEKAAMLVEQAIPSRAHGLPPPSYLPQPAHDLFTASDKFISESQTRMLHRTQKMLSREEAVEEALKALKRNPGGHFDYLGDYQRTLQGNEDILRRALMERFKQRELVLGQTMAFSEETGGMVKGFADGIGIGASPAEVYRQLPRVIMKQTGNTPTSWMENFADIAPRDKAEQLRSLMKANADEIKDLILKSRRTDQSVAEAAKAQRAAPLPKAPEGPALRPTKAQEREAFQAAWKKGEQAIPDSPEKAEQLRRRIYKAGLNSDANDYQNYANEMYRKRAKEAGLLGEGADLKQPLLKQDRGICAYDAACSLLINEGHPLTFSDRKALVSKILELNPDYGSRRLDRIGTSLEELKAALASPGELRVVSEDWAAKFEKQVADLEDWLNTKSPSVRTNLKPEHLEELKGLLKTAKGLGLPEPSQIRQLLQRVKKAEKGLPTVGFTADQTREFMQSVAARFGKELVELAPNDVERMLDYMQQGHPVYARLNTGINRHRAVIGNPFLAPASDGKYRAFVQIADSNNEKGVVGLLEAGQLRKILAEEGGHFILLPKGAKAAPASEAASAMDKAGRAIVEKIPEGSKGFVDKGLEDLARMMRKVTGRPLAEDYFAQAEKLYSKAASAADRAEARSALLKGMIKRLEDAVQGDGALRAQYPELLDEISKMGRKTKDPQELLDQLNRHVNNQNVKNLIQKLENALHQDKALRSQHSGFLEKLKEMRRTGRTADQPKIIEHARDYYWKKLDNAQRAQLEKAGAKIDSPTLELARMDSVDLLTPEGVLRSDAMAQDVAQAFRRLSGEEAAKGRALALDRAASEAPGPGAKALDPGEFGKMVSVLDDELAKPLPLRELSAEEAVETIYQAGRADLEGHFSALGLDPSLLKANKEQVKSALLERELMRRAARERGIPLKAAESPFPPHPGENLRALKQRAQQLRSEMDAADPARKALLEKERVPLWEQMTAQEIMDSSQFEFIQKARGGMADKQAALRALVDLKALQKWDSTLQIPWTKETTSRLYDHLASQLSKAEGTADRAHLQTLAGKWKREQLKYQYGTLEMPKAVQAGKERALYNRTREKLSRYDSSDLEAAQAWMPAQCMRRQARGTCAYGGVGNLFQREINAGGLKTKDILGEAFELNPKFASRVGEGEAGLFLNGLDNERTKALVKRMADKTGREAVEINPEKIADYIEATGEPVLVTIKAGQDNHVMLVWRKPGDIDGNGNIFFRTIDTNNPMGTYGKISAEDMGELVQGNGIALRPKDEKLAQKAMEASQARPLHVDEDLLPKQLPGEEPRATALDRMVPGGDSDAAKAAQTAKGAENLRVSGPEAPGFRPGFDPDHPARLPENYRTISEGSPIPGKRGPVKPIETQGGQKFGEKTPHEGIPNEALRGQARDTLAVMQKEAELRSRGLLPAKGESRVRVAEIVGYGINKDGKEAMIMEWVEGGVPLSKAEGLTPADIAPLEDYLKIMKKEKGVEFYDLTADNILFVRGKDGKPNFILMDVHIESRSIAEWVNVIPTEKTMPLIKRGLGQPQIVRDLENTYRKLGVSMEDIRADWSPEERETLLKTFLEGKEYRPEQIRELRVQLELEAPGAKPSAPRATEGPAGPAREGLRAEIKKLESEIEAIENKPGARREDFERLKRLDAELASARERLRAAEAPHAKTPADILADRKGIKAAPSGEKRNPKIFELDHNNAKSLEPGQYNYVIFKDGRMEAWKHEFSPEGKLLEQGAHHQDMALGSQGPREVAFAGQFTVEKGANGARVKIDLQSGHYSQLENGLTRPEYFYKKENVEPLQKAAQKILGSEVKVDVVHPVLGKAPIDSPSEMAKFEARFGEWNQRDMERKAGPAMKALKENKARYEKVRAEMLALAKKGNPTPEEMAKIAQKTIPDEDLIKIAERGNITSEERTKLLKLIEEGRALHKKTHDFPAQFIAADIQENALRGAYQEARGNGLAHEKAVEAAVKKLEAMPSPYGKPSPERIAEVLKDEAAKAGARRPLEIERFEPAKKPTDAAEAEIARQKQKLDGQIERFEPTKPTPEAEAEIARQKGLLARLIEPFYPSAKTDAAGSLKTQADDLLRRPAAAPLPGAGPAQPYRPSQLPTAEEIERVRRIEAAPDGAKVEITPRDQEVYRFLQENPGYKPPQPQAQRPLTYQDFVDHAKKTGGLTDSQFDGLPTQMKRIYFEDFARKHGLSPGTNKAVQDKLFYLEDFRKELKNVHGVELGELSPRQRDYYLNLYRKKNPLLPDSAYQGIRNNLEFAPEPKATALQAPLPSPQKPGLWQRFKNTLGVGKKPPETPSLRGTLGHLPGEEAADLSRAPRRSPARAPDGTERFEIGKKGCPHGDCFDGGISTPREDSPRREHPVVDRKLDKDLQNDLESINQRLKEAGLGEGSLKGAKELEALDILHGHYKPQRAVSEDAVRALEKQLEGQPVMLGACIKQGQGACRHLAMAQGVALEQMIQEGRLSGKVHYIRGEGHGWTLYQAGDGKYYVLDAALQEKVLPLEGARYQLDGVWHSYADAKDFQRVLGRTEEAAKAQRAEKIAAKLRLAQVQNVQDGMSAGDAAARGVKGALEGKLKGYDITDADMDFIRDNRRLVHEKAKEALAGIPGARAPKALPEPKPGSFHDLDQPDALGRAAKSLGGSSEDMERGMKQVDRMDPSEVIEKQGHVNPSLEIELGGEKYVLKKLTDFGSPEGRRIAQKYLVSQDVAGLTPRERAMREHAGREIARLLGLGIPEELAILKKGDSYYVLTKKLDAVHDDGHILQFLSPQQRAEVMNLKLVFGMKDAHMGQFLIDPAAGKLFKIDNEAIRFRPVEIHGTIPYTDIDKYGFPGISRFEVIDKEVYMGAAERWSKNFGVPEMTEHSRLFTKGFFNMLVESGYAPKEAAQYVKAIRKNLGNFEKNLDAYLDVNRRMVPQYLAQAGRPMDMGTLGGVLESKGRSPLLAKAPKEGMLGRMQEAVEGAWAGVKKWFSSPTAADHFSHAENLHYQALLEKDPAKAKRMLDAARKKTQQGLLSGLEETLKKDGALREEYPRLLEEIGTLRRSGVEDPLNLLQHANRHMKAQNLDNLIESLEKAFKKDPSLRQRHSGLLNELQRARKAATSADLPGIMEKAQAYLGKFDSKELRQISQAGVRTSPGMELASVGMLNRILPESAFPSPMRQDVIDALRQASGGWMPPSRAGTAGHLPPAARTAKELKDLPPEQLRLASGKRIPPTEKDALPTAEIFRGKNAEGRDLAHKTMMPGMEQIKDEHGLNFLQREERQAAKAHEVMGAAKQEELGVFMQKPVYAVIDGKPTLVSDWIPGHTLEDIIAGKADIRIAPADYQRLEDFIEALGKKGYAHGDIHARNIKVYKNPSTGRIEFTILDMETFGEGKTLLGYARIDPKTGKIMSIFKEPSSKLGLVPLTAEKADSLALKKIKSQLMEKEASESGLMARMMRLFSGKEGPAGMAKPFRKPAEIPEIKPAKSVLRELHPKPGSVTDMHGAYLYETRSGKKLAAKPLAGKENPAVLRNEAEILRQIEQAMNQAERYGHPFPSNFRVPRLVDYGQMDASVLRGGKARKVETIVMEQAEGKPLLDYLQEGGKIPKKDWERFREGVARLPDYGITHGDIHIGNIHVHRDPKTGETIFTLLDFGQGRRLGRVDSDADLFLLRQLDNDQLKFAVETEMHRLDALLDAPEASAWQRVGQRESLSKFEEDIRSLFKKEGPASGVEPASPSAVDNLIERMKSVESRPAQDHFERARELTLHARGASQYRKEALLQDALGEFRKGLNKALEGKNPELRELWIREAALTPQEKLIVAAHYLQAKHGMDISGFKLQEMLGPHLAAGPPSELLQLERSLNADLPPLWRRTQEELTQHLSDRYIGEAGSLEERLKIETAIAGRMENPEFREKALQELRKRGIATEVACQEGPTCVLHAVKNAFFGSHTSIEDLQTLAQKFHNPRQGELLDSYGRMKRGLHPEEQEALIKAAIDRVWGGEGQIKQVMLHNLLYEIKRSPRKRVFITMDVALADKAAGEARLGGHAVAVGEPVEINGKSYFTLFDSDKFGPPRMVTPEELSKLVNGGAFTILSPDEPLFRGLEKVSQALDTGPAAAGKMTLAQAQAELKRLGDLKKPQPGAKKGIFAAVGGAAALVASAAAISDAADKEKHSGLEPEPTKEGKLKEIIDRLSQKPASPAPILGQVSKLHGGQALLDYVTGGKWKEGGYDIHEEGIPTLDGTRFKIGYTSALGPSTRGMHQPLVRLGVYDHTILINEALKDSKVEEYVLIHELTHAESAMKLFFKQKPPEEADMAIERAAHLREIHAYVQDHPDITTMPVPESPGEDMTWLMARIWAGNIEPERYSYGSRPEMKEALQEICDKHRASDGACGGRETLFKWLQATYSGTGEGDVSDSTNPELRKILEEFEAQAGKQDDEFYKQWKGKKNQQPQRQIP